MLNALQMANTVDIVRSEQDVYYNIANFQEKCYLIHQETEQASN